MIDAHNHLHEFRDRPDFGEILQLLADGGIKRWVVNGTQESDWDAVAELSASHPRQVVPYFGLHPWYVHDKGALWASRLAEHLECHPNAGLGEIGIDRWIRNHQIDTQVPIFIRQLQLAAQYGRPATIHCLRAFGRLREILDENLRPSEFLLHGYSGPSELVDCFVKMGAYFSFGIRELQKRNELQFSVLQTIPLDRILIETDATTAQLTGDATEYNLLQRLSTAYDLAAGLLGMPRQEFTVQVRENFERFHPA